MAGVEDLHAAASEYLAACVDALALTAAGPPARRFVSHGPPPLDCCPMLSVNVGVASVAGTAPTGGALQAGHRIATTGVVEQVTLTATIVRCVPDAKGEPLTPAQHEAVAEETNADLWAIVNWLIARKRDESLYPHLCREFQIGNAVARTVDGLCAGWLIPIVVTVDGFTPDAT